MFRSDLCSFIFADRVIICRHIHFVNVVWGWHNLGMEPLPETLRQQFTRGLFLHDPQLIPSNVKYKLWSRPFWGLVTLGITIFMLVQAIRQPIWPDPVVIRDNWPSSLLLLALILGWYVAIGYFLYWTVVRFALFIGQQQEQAAQARGVCRYGMLLTEEMMILRLPTRPFSKKREWIWEKTAVTGASGFLKRDNRNVGHWHLRISYINQKGVETSTSFPYDEFYCGHVDELAEGIEKWLLG